MQVSFFVLDSYSLLIYDCSKLQQASLYLAINYNIKKIQTEGVSNVLTSIRRLRYYNLPVLEQEQELTFIWNATKLFIEQNRQL